MWAVYTFLAFNVYVWCRVYFYLFDLLRLFAGMKYSISILAAGATMIPALFGPMGFLLLVGFVGAYILLYRFLFIRNPAEYNDFVREKARDSAAGTELSRLQSNLSLAASESGIIARTCFDQLDPQRQRPRVGEPLVHRAVERRRRRADDQVKLAEIRRRQHAARELEVDAGEPAEPVAADRLLPDLGPDGPGGRFAPRLAVARG